MTKIFTLLFLLLFSLSVFSQKDETTANLEILDNKNWKLVFSDSCTGNWKNSWFLDGEIATAENSVEGMHLKAGPDFGNDAHHMVLWTKQSFKGDVKIEFDYTRTDNETRAVNILYIQATGKGEGEFVKDISEWNHLRKVPAMRTYYNNMNALHISFAAFPNSEETEDYIRVRRYPVTTEKGFQQLEIEPTYFNTGIFIPGETYHITVAKTDEYLFFEVTGSDQSKLYEWNTKHLPPLKAGRIGLRHMYTRSAVYKNFKVFTK